MNQIDRWGRYTLVLAGQAFALLGAQKDHRVDEVREADSDLARGIHQQAGGQGVPPQGLNVRNGLSRLRAQCLQLG